MDASSKNILKMATAIFIVAIAIAGSLIYTLPS